VLKIIRTADLKVPFDCKLNCNLVVTTSILTMLSIGGRRDITLHIIFKKIKQ